MGSFSTCSTLIPTQWRTATTRTDLFELTSLESITEVSDWQVTKTGKLSTVSIKSRLAQRVKCVKTNHIIRKQLKIVGDSQVNPCLSLRYYFVGDCQ